MHYLPRVEVSDQTFEYSRLFVHEVSRQLRCHLRRGLDPQRATGRDKQGYQLELFLFDVAESP